MADNVPPCDVNLIAQIRDAYARAAYTHKTHEKQADAFYNKHLRQRRVLVALTAVGSATFLTSLFGHFLSDAWVATATSFIAVLVSAITLATENFKHGEAMQKHRDTAAKVWNIRESYLSLLVDMTAGVITSESARTQRDDLQQQAYEVYSEAPRTTGDAYNEAQDAIQNREELTFSDDEIDRILPPQLRRTLNGGPDASC